MKVLSLTAALLLVSSFSWAGIDGFVLSGERITAEAQKSACMMEPQRFFGERIVLDAKSYQEHETFSTGLSDFMANYVGLGYNGMEFSVEGIGSSTGEKYRLACHARITQDEDSSLSTSHMIVYKVSLRSSYTPVSGACSVMRERDGLTSTPDALCLEVWTSVGVPRN